MAGISRRALWSCAAKPVQPSEGEPLIPATVSFSERIEGGKTEWIVSLWTGHRHRPKYVSERRFDDQEDAIRYALELMPAPRAPPG